MDLVLLIGIAVSLLGVVISLYFFMKKREAEIREIQQQAASEANSRVPQQVIPRRAQIQRNQRNRLRNTAQQHTEDDHQQLPRHTEVHDDDNDENHPDTAKFDKKVGAKKLAKLEAKAEKRAHREAELQMREEKKKKDAVLEEQRRAEEQKAEEAERKREEAERLAREAQQRKEHEEYLKLKQQFAVEEEGFEEGDEDENNLLKEFIDYIKQNKVVILENLASHFKLKTQQVIDRVKELQEQGVIDGVIDDRGKFIYISEDELNSVAKFIRQRGRVSITELAECSNNLINLSAINVQ